jgi:hypothetical protein
MSRIRRPARPAPPPKTETAKRLEHVRTQNGLPSLRSFWQRLQDGWEDGASYEAVRGYHWNREPPAAYLARVAQVFGVRLEWLITGTGPQTNLDAALLDLVERPPDAMRQALSGKLDWLRLSPGLEARVMEVFIQFHAARTGMYELAGWDAPAPTDSAHVFADVLLASHRAFAPRGTTYVLGMQWWRTQQLIEAALHALVLAIPDGHNVYWNDESQEGTSDAEG